MNKFLLQTPNKDIYTFVIGTGWIVLGNGEPTSSMFIKNGITSIDSSNLQSLITLTGNVDIDVLATNQADPVIIEHSILTEVALDGEASYKKVNIDLSQYALINSVSIVEI